MSTIHEAKTLLGLSMEQWERAKPILFNTEMVRAIKENRKTVTRRVVKPQPAATSCVRRRPGNTWDWAFWEDDRAGHRIRTLCRPGDILYVRETWTTLIGSYLYKADQKPGMKNPGKWRPSIHMPKGAARLFLRVTGVRVERLQESFFSPGTVALDCQVEGIDIGDQCRECIETYGNPPCISDEDGDDESECECGILDDIRDEFAKLWDSTIKPADLALYGWDANPWVWVIEFERIIKKGA